MQYRVWYSQRMNHYKVQRRKNGWFRRWVWLDVCNAWCNWYGKGKPKIFDCRKDIEDFLACSDWKIKVIITTTEEGA